MFSVLRYRVRILVLHNDFRDWLSPASYKCNSIKGPYTCNSLPKQSIIYAIKYFL